MFTLGAVTCPRCSGELTLSSIEVSTDWLRADAELVCRSCPADWSLAVTLSARGPLPDSGPSSRRAEPEADQVPELSGLAHVPTSPASHPSAAECRDDAGGYRCPICGARSARAQALAAHFRTHEVPEPCPGGCGRLIKRSGLGRHRSWGCPGPSSNTGPKIPDPPEDPEPAEPPAKAPGRAPLPPAPARGSSRLPDAEATARARAAAKEKAKAAKPAEPAEPGEPGEPPAPAPPLPGPSHQVCRMVDEAGECGRTKEALERGWRRARVPAGWLDLCPDHRDASDDQVAALLAATTPGGSDG